MNRYLLIFCFAGLICLSSKGQQLFPKYVWWTFDSSSSVFADTSGNNLALNQGTNTALIESGGLVRQYFRNDSDYTRLGNDQIDPNQTVQDSLEISFECLFRTAQYFHRANIGEWTNRALMTVSENALSVTIYVQSGTSALTFEVNLDGIGRKSSGYLLDGNWHHLAFTWSSKTGVLKIYVDGISPPGFQAYFGPQSPLNTSQRLTLGGWEKITSFKGCLDELAYYNGLLPPELIWQHYQEVMVGEHYNDTLLFTGIVPDGEPVIDSIYNPLEYVPGYPNPTLRTVEMIRHYPAPRYQPGNILPTINALYGRPEQLALLDTFQTYSGTLPQGSSRIADSVQYHVWDSVQRQLILYYNHSLLLGATSINQARSSYFTDSSRRVFWSTNLANEYPDVRRSIFSSWPQVKPELISALNKNCGFSGNAINYLLGRGTCLDDSYFLQDSTNGNVLTRKYWDWSKITVPGPGLDTTLGFDAEHNVHWLKEYFAHLNDPAIDVVMENGEALGKRNRNLMRLDSSIRRDRGQTGWDEYESSRATMFRQYYSGILLDTVNFYRGSSPGDSAYFNWYNIGGVERISKFDYPQARLAMPTFQGAIRSTPFFYPQSPVKWMYGNFTEPGYQQISNGRREEIAAGDHLFQPWVAPGFKDNRDYNSVDVTMNRPGPFLGQLKALAGLGADSYALFMRDDYTITLDTSTGNLEYEYLWPGSFRIWKTVIPSYAQAITSRVAEFYNPGELLETDIQYGQGGGGTGVSIFYTFSTGDLNDLVIIRRSSLDPHRYLITGTTQRGFNGTSVGLKEKQVCITNPDTSSSYEQLCFNIRPQGSTYILDFGDSTFIQLDGWHEWKAPWYWCPDYAFEAEVMDSSSGADTLYTIARSGPDTLDFRSFRSYLSFDQPILSGSNPVLEYGFIFRDQEQDSLNLLLQARVPGGGNKSVEVRLNGVSVGTISGINSTTWEWVPNLGPFWLKGLEQDSAYTLALYPSDSGLQLDKILLRRSSLLPGSQSPSFSLQNDTLCLQDTLSLFPVVSGLFDGCVDWYWDFGDGTVSYTPDSAFHRYQAPGSYKVKLVLSAFCTGETIEDSAWILIQGPLVDAGEAIMYCPGSLDTLAGKVENAASFTWRSDSIFISRLDTLTPQISPVGSSWLYLEAGDQNGCTALDSLLVAPLSLTAEAAEDSVEFCLGASEELVVKGGYFFDWSPGASLNDSTLATPLASPDTSTLYTVIVEDACRCVRDTVNIWVEVLIAGELISTDTTYCLGDSVYLVANGASTYSWHPGSLVTDSSVAQPGLKLQEDLWVSVEMKGAGCTLTDSVRLFVDSACCVVPFADTVLSTVRSSQWADTLSGLTLHIQDSLIVDRDLRLIQCKLYMDQEAVILIRPGVELFSNVMQYLSACRDTMWEGIVVFDSTARFRSSNDQIEDAEIGVCAKSGGDVQLTNARFDLNGTHMVFLGGVQGMHPASIRGSHFVCSNVQDMLAPFKNQATQAGIRVVEVGNGTIQIGETDTISDQNYFSGLDLGLDIQKSNTRIYNNRFSLMPATQETRGWGIKVSGVPGWLSPACSHIIGGDSSLQTNSFEDLAVGIWSDHNEDFEIHKNAFIRVDDQAVWIRNNHFQTININGNELEDVYDGIRLTLIGGCVINIRDNNLTNDTNSQTYSAISISDIGFTTTRDTIKGNTLSLTGRGMHFLNLRNLVVDDNTVVLHSPLPLWMNSVGMELTNCEGAKVYNNELTSDINNASYQTYGIKTMISKQALFSCNEVSLLGRGMVFNSDCILTELWKNEFRNGRVGLEFENSGHIGRQGGPSEPTDNIWEISGGLSWGWDYETAADSLDNQLFGARMFIRDSSYGQFYSPELNGPRINTVPNFRERVQFSPAIPPFQVYECPKKIIGSGGYGNGSYLFQLAQDSISFGHFSNILTYLSKEFLYSQLLEKDTLLDNYEEYALAYEGLLDGVYDEMYDAKVALDSADGTGFLSRLNSVKSDSAFIKTEVDILKKYYLLQTAIQDTFLNSIADSLRLIADQCFFEGGSGVLLARAIYALIEPDRAYSDACVPVLKRKGTINAQNHVLPENSLSVFPNPGYQTLHFLCKYENAYIRVRSLLGSQMASFTLNPGLVHQISVTGWPNGVYLVEANLGNGETLIKKIVIQK